MKTRSLLNISAILFVFALLIGLAGCKNNNGDATVKPQSINITGDLADYLQIVDAEYKVTQGRTGGSLPIKIRAIKQLKDTSAYNRNFRIAATFLNESGNVISDAPELWIASNPLSYNTAISSLLKNGSGEAAIELQEITGRYKADEFAGKIKTFSVTSSLVKEEASTSSKESSLNNGEGNDASDEIDNFLNDYEEFVAKWEEKAKDGELTLSDMTDMNAELEEIKTRNKKASEKKENDLKPDQAKRMTKLGIRFSAVTSKINASK